MSLNQQSCFGGVSTLLEFLALILFCCDPCCPSLWVLLDELKVDESYNYNLSILAVEKKNTSPRQHCHNSHCSVEIRKSFFKSGIFEFSKEHNEMSAVVLKEVKMNFP